MAVKRFMMNYWVRTKKKEKIENPFDSRVYYTVHTTIAMHVLGCALLSTVSLFTVNIDASHSPQKLNYPG